MDAALRLALQEHLDTRLAKAGRLKPSDPLYLTQKGGAYSPNTLQEHMALMLREWAGIEKASSHSGRRSVINNVINPLTTLIYEEPPEGQLAEALKNL